MVLSLLSANRRFYFSARSVKDCNPGGPIPGRVCNQATICCDFNIHAPKLFHRKAAEHMIPTQLEMGGKNPSVVLEDADLDEAARQIVAATYACAGQWCTSTSRAIVVEKIAAEELFPANTEGHKEECVYNRETQSVTVPSRYKGAIDALIGAGFLTIADEPEIGGMLRVGIPKYRLPRKVLDKEIADIKALGVTFKTDAKIKDINELKDYDAVFVATGAHVSGKLGVPGENAAGVISGTEFLRQLNLDGEDKIGKNVIVVGGGNTAMDAARVAGFPAQRIVFLAFILSGALAGLAGFMYLGRQGTITSWQPRGQRCRPSRRWWSAALRCRAARARFSVLSLARS
jgi:hypothetical protein